MNRTDEFGEPLPPTPEQDAERRRHLATMVILFAVLFALTVGWAWREWGPQPRPLEVEKGAVPEWMPEEPDPGPLDE